MEIVPLILCGGEGSRLWPLTSEITPKHMLKLPSGKTLFGETYDRAKALVKINASKPLILTATNQRFENAINRHCLMQASDDANIEINSSILIEPLVRDTAPAICIAALSLMACGRDEAILVVLPADHKIENSKAFQKTVQDAAKYAEQNELVCIGIKPGFASSAFGYLEVSNGLVSKFTEKPTLEIAREFVFGGNHLWNSGIFCCKANVLVDLLKIHCPELMTQCQLALKNAKTEHRNSGSIVTFKKHDFEKIENKSIDYQLLNSLTGMRCVRAQFSWSDIGSWDSFCDLFGKDTNGNSQPSFGFSENSSNCSAFSSRKPVAILGLKDVVVVNTDQAILVADKKYAQNVRHLKKEITKQADCKLVKNAEHTKLPDDHIRPWGNFEILIEKKGYKVKRLIVNPFQSLSLQSHKFRSEHWLVVEGSAVVTLSDDQIALSKNEHIDIPIGEKHRISNPSSQRLIIIETQTGTYLGEDDEIRYEDMYGRADNLV